MLFLVVIIPNVGGWVYILFCTFVHCNLILVKHSFGHIVSNHAGLSLVPPYQSVCAQMKDYKAILGQDLIRRGRGTV